MLLCLWIWPLSKVLASPSEPPELCQSAQELKQISSYLKAEKDLNLNETQQLKLSLEVASNCTGSAKRFQRVYKQLALSGVNIPKAVEIALEFSKKTDQQVGLFLESFKMLFLEQKYDLTFQDSYLWARMYSSAPDSQLKSLQDDLRFLIQFCLEDKKDLLPLPTCRDFTLSLLQIAAQEHRGSVKEDFKMLLSFLNDGKGPKYPIEKNLQIIVEILKLGSNATEQFIESYQFAQSKEGLSLSPEQSYRIAYKSAQSSQKQK